MEVLLELAADLPRRAVAAGEVLLAEGDVGGTLFVLIDGALRIEKDGVPIATIAEPGICVGEMSLLLDVPATADVVAPPPSTVAFAVDARSMLSQHPDLASTSNADQRRAVSASRRCYGESRAFSPRTVSSYAARREPAHRVIGDTSRNRA